MPSASPPWMLAALRLDTPSCPVAGRETTARVTCPAGRRQPGDALAFSPGEAPAGWEPVVGLHRGALVRPRPGGSADCSRCPLLDLPPDVHPLRVEAGGDGVRVEAALPRDRLDDLLGRLRRRGQGPRVVRLGHGGGPAGTGVRPTARLVDLGGLTARQEEAVRLARETGYFLGDADVADLARAMGCSRSTAHEHLRKGLARLAAAVFP